MLQNKSTKRIAISIISLMSNFGNCQASSYGQVNDSSEENLDQFPDPTQEQIQRLHLFTNGQMSEKEDNRMIFEIQENPKLKKIYLEMRNGEIIPETARLFPEPTTQQIQRVRLFIADSLTESEENLAIREIQGNPKLRKIYMEMLEPTYGPQELTFGNAQ